MAWHYMAKPNHYQQNLSHSYGEKLRALTREAKSCIKVHEMLVEIGKGSGGKGSADRKGYGSKPKAISELEETNPIAGPSFGPWQISSSKNSFLVQTFKPLSGKKCTDTATPNAKPTAKIFRRRGSRAAADDPAARQLYPLHHMLPV